MFGAVAVEFPERRIGAVRGYQQQESAVRSLIHLAFQAHCQHNERFLESRRRVRIADDRREIRSGFWRWRCGGGQGKG